MIFHTIYTITIGEFAEIIESKNYDLIKRIHIWLPKKIIKRAYSKLVIEHNKNSSRDKIQELLDSDFDKFDVIYEVVKLELLYKQISIWYQTFDKESLKDIEYLFENIFGYIPKQDDFKKVITRKNLLLEKAEQTFKPESESKKKEVDFEGELIILEKIISPITLRDKKLYTYPKYVESALQKVENNG